MSEDKGDDDMETPQELERPTNLGRPRSIIEDYERVSEGYHSPETKRVTISAIREWAKFLRSPRYSFRPAVESERVTVHHYIAWVNELHERGFTRGLRNRAGLVRGYYLLKGSREPGSKWSKLASELKAFRLPKTTGKKDPHKPYPLAVLPTILEAARRTKHYTKWLGDRKEEVYSEAYTLVATFLYAGGRAQWYSLTDDQVREALKKKYVELYVKKAEYVFVPIPDQLLEIWKEHLERRDFSGPFFFRHGRNPFTWQEGKATRWEDDVKAGKSNNGRVQYILRDVEFVLKSIFGVDEVLTSHRFRKSVGTYMEYYGFTEAERRLQLSHGAGEITKSYSVPSVLESQRKLSKMDLGNAEWVAAHDPPTNLFASGNGHDAELLAENRDLRKKLDELLARLARLEPKGGA